MAVFWVVAPCSLLEVYQRWLIALMMKAASISETSINFYQTTWRNHQEDWHLHARRRENIKSHKNTRSYRTTRSSGHECYIFQSPDSCNMQTDALLFNSEFRSRIGDSWRMIVQLSDICVSCYICILQHTFCTYIHLYYIPWIHKLVRWQQDVE
jgi:hypothetical protein